MMETAVISVDDAPAWLDAMSRAGARDVYYLPNYHQLHCSRGVRWVAFTARSGNDALFYPFLLRPIRRIGAIEVAPALHDIVTVYGYTGPAATTDSPDFLNTAWRHFETWCREQAVVSEFIRFNPLLRTERFAASGVDVAFDRPTVEIDLDCDEAALWSSYEPEQRNRVRKAIKKGLTCEEVGLESGLPTFVSLYEETMRRARAADHYLFSARYYNTMAAQLLQHCRLFIVRHGGDALAAGLFFTYETTIHYHLGGSSAEALSLGPNNLLFHHVAVWGQQRGFKRLHLGGGRSNAADDSLLRFKKRFSHRLLSFHIGKRVHDPAQYERLCRLWAEQSDSPLSTTYFPAYRAVPEASTTRSASTRVPDVEHV